MKQVICIDDRGVKGVRINRRYRVERETTDYYIIYNDLQLAASYDKERFSESEKVEDRFREALERIASLTPQAANARTARDLYLTVKAIAESALSDHPSQ